MTNHHEDRRDQGRHQIGLVAQGGRRTVGEQDIAHHSPGEPRRSRQGGNPNDIEPTPRC